MTSSPWGGSEELWSRTALDLVAQGFPVSAVVFEWSPLHPRVQELKARGVDVQVYPQWYSLRQHPLRRIASGEESCRDGYRAAD